MGKIFSARPVSMEVFKKRIFEYTKENSSIAEEFVMENKKKMEYADNKESVRLPDEQGAPVDNMSSSEKLSKNRGF